MARVLLGIVIGAASVGLLWSIFDRVDVTDVPASEAVVRPANTGELSERASPRSEQIDENSATSVATPVPDRITRDSDPVSVPSGIAAFDPDPEVRLVAQLEQAQDAATQAGDELADFRIAEMLAASEIVTSIRLPPEFDWVSQQRYPNMFHEQFQREPIDIAWSAGMEADFLRFIYAHTEFIEKYGHPTVRCHSVRCEVLFTTESREDKRAPVDVGALSDELLAEMSGAFDCEDFVCLINANRQDGTTTIFWGMHRRVERTQSLVARATE